MQRDQREEFEHDWYGILGCEVGSSIEDLQKAARKLALKYHPDKTTDPDAPAKFLLIQKAKEILADEGKKKVIDDHFAAAKKRAEYESERNRGMDERRKRFRDALEKNVDSATKRSLDPNEVLAQEVRKKSKIIESIRRQNQTAMQQASDELRRKMDQKAADFASYSETIAREYGKNCQIKIKWKKSMTHDEQSLHYLLKSFGDIEDIAISASKGSSAVVTFATAAAARKVVDNFATSEDYRVSFVDEEKGSSRPRVFSHVYSSTSNTSSSSSVQEEFPKKEVDQTFRATNPIETKADYTLKRISKDEFLAKEKETLEIMRNAAAAFAKSKTLPNGVGVH